MRWVIVPWAAQTSLEPSCIFAPGNAKQLSFAIKHMASLGSQFAMRGGGHMPAAGSHSISKGVLISSTNLDMLHLSKDKSILSIGPGRRWNDAFQFLEGSDRSVVGARSTHVGIPGYLLRGGISFYSYEYGLGSTNGNVKSYECVLTDGKIVRATSSNRYSDLFWALQAGGNSLCLVTRFEVKTIHSPLTMIASPSYGSNVSSEYIDSVFNYAINGHADPKGVVLPVIQYTSGASAPSYSATLFYNGNDTSPHILQDFLGGLITPVNLNASKPLSPMSLGQYSRLETPVFEKGGQTYGRRQRFHLLPILAKRDAMQLVHDKYFEGARTHFNNTPDVGTGLAFNPITKQLLAATNAEPGALQGLDETPALWIELTFSWDRTADDTVVESFIQSFEAEIQIELANCKASGSFYYMNESDKGQPVFESYPAGNLARLKNIRRKYDPSRVFTDLMPGGFKIEPAHS